MRSGSVSQLVEAFISMFDNLLIGTIPTEIGLMTALRKKYKMFTATIRTLAHKAATQNIRTLMETSSWEHCQLNMAS